MPTTTSAADRTDTGLNEESLDELELLADEAVALPSGGVWLPRSGSVVRPEVWLPALGLVEWSDPGVVAAQEFEEVLAGPEVQIQLGAKSGLSKSQLEDVLQRVIDKWAQSEIIVAAVDSISLKVKPATSTS
jgi:hypothetical protein